jgi:acetolactate synthase-1/2/3 large subunit
MSINTGPGRPVVVTGIATAHTDSIPMVVISGQVSSAVIGNDAFQEADAVGITRSCVFEFS